MGKTCILTDNAAQFTQPAFPGRNLIRILPFNIEIDGRIIGNENFKISHLPKSIGGNHPPRLIPLEEDKLTQYLLDLGKEYSQILGIFSSPGMLPSNTIFSSLAEELRGKVEFHFLDSQTISIGLGLLLQAAGDNLEKDTPFDEVEKIIRSMVPKVFTLLCAPNLSYLCQSGFVDHAQATVGEMLGLLSIFTLEEGILSHSEKVRTFRQVFDLYLEFLDEFDDFRHIALVQGTPTHIPETKLLRDHIQNEYPKAPFTEHNLSLPVATLLGPGASAIFIMESEL